MKIKKVYFGLIVISIVLGCLVLGYGVYESVFKANEYVRIYQTSVDLNDKEINGIHLNDLEVKFTGYDFHEVEDDGDDADDELEMYLDFKLSHKDEIILEPCFDYIVYDENNNILAFSSTLLNKNGSNRKILDDFIKEKYNTKDVQAIWEHSIGEGYNYTEIENETPGYERRITALLPKDYRLEGNLYIRVFGISYKVESVENKIEYFNDMLEFVVTK